MSAAVGPTFGEAAVLRLGYLKTTTTTQNKIPKQTPKNKQTIKQTNERTIKQKTNKQTNQLTNKQHDHANGQNGYCYVGKFRRLKDNLSFLVRDSTIAHTTLIR